MQNTNQTSMQVQQAEELQAKIDYLRGETSQLLVELTTLYAKYASVLQENISLKSRVGKLDSQAK